MARQHDRTLIIANPEAAADNALSTAVQELRQEGRDIETAPTEAPGDAARLCREGVNRGITRIIAAGGDGTLNEVANALLTAVASHVTLGVLPYGTANDFARANGLAPNDLATSLSVALNNRPRQVDVVRCNDRYFINSCTVGFGATVTSDTQSGIKSILGGASYLLTALGRISDLQPYSMNIQGDDIEWQGEAVGLAITNGRQAGGGIVIAPEARINDGIIEGMLFPAMNLSSAAYLLQQLSTGERPAGNGNGNGNGGIVLLRGSDLRVRADRPLPMTLDGEPAEYREFRLTVCQGLLAMALPADSSLLQA